MKRREKNHVNQHKKYPMIVKKLEKEMNVLGIRPEGQAGFRNERGTIGVSEKKGSQ